MVGNSCFSSSLPAIGDITTTFGITFVDTVHTLHYNTSVLTFKLNGLSVVVFVSQREYNSLKEMVS